MSTAEQTARTPNRPWQTLVLVALGAVVVALYSSLGRALWIDEFLHFALGALPVETALTVIYETTAVVNHGQTGVYMLVDLALLKAGGANLLLMRLPSLISAALLLTASVYFIRTKGLSFDWQILTIVAFGAQSVLMYHGGDARPYMVLTATTVSMLAYYATPVAARGRWLPRLLGGFGILIGSISHPYFILFLPLVFAYATWNAHRDGSLKLVLPSLVEFLNLRFVIPAGFLYVGVGLLTWMKGSPAFAFDPWEPWGGDAVAVVRGVVGSHLGFLVPRLPYGPVLLAALLAILGLLLLLALRTFGWDALSAPFVLLIGGFVSTGVISVASVVRDYWIFDRQWVAGMAIVTLASIWMIGRIWELAGHRASRIWRLTILAIVALICANAAFTLVAKGRDISHAVAAWGAVAPDLELPTPAEAARYDNDAWVALANRVVLNGGSIPPEVGWYYVKPSAE